MNPMDMKVCKGTYDDAPGNDPATFLFLFLETFMLIK
jgi:hypothetical protein